MLCCGCSPHPCHTRGSSVCPWMVPALLLSIRSLGPPSLAPELLLPWGLRSSCRLELSWGSKWRWCPCILSPSLLDPEPLLSACPLHAGDSPLQFCFRETGENLTFPLTKLDYSWQPSFGGEQEEHLSLLPLCPQRGLAPDQVSPCATFRENFCLTFGHLSGIWRAGRRRWSLTGLLASARWPITSRSLPGHMPPTWGLQETCCKLLRCPGEPALLALCLQAPRGSDKKPQPGAARALEKTYLQDGLR